MATRGSGVDTPHSDVRNCSNDHGMAGVRPGVVVVAYDGEERRGIKLLRGVCFREQRKSTERTLKVKPFQKERRPSSG